MSNAINLWAKFERLLPAAAIQMGTVSAVHSDGTCTLDLPGGGTVRVLGSGFSLGQNIFYRAGAVVGEAPSLPLYTVTV